MTDERALYETDRAAWLAYVAPNMARKISTSTDEQIRRDWNGMARDYQTAVWSLLPEAQKQRIRTLRSGK